MRILHICNDFCGSKVHSELYKKLDALGIEQTIYTYYRGVGKEGVNQFESKRSVFYYRSILKKRHRILYHQKVRTVYNDLKNVIEENNFDVIHATTLFSDGAIAYKLNRECGIPYVVTVRGTDINEFMLVAVWAWSLGIKILRNASKIVFISKAPMEKFCHHFMIKRILPEIQEKFLLQPNGIDDYWLDNIWRGEKKTGRNILYFGRFDVNKNVVRLIKAVLSLKEYYKDIHLHLVGGNGCNENIIYKLVHENRTHITCHGIVTDKKELQSLYRKCDVFAMPSIHETLGLVYIEALTQGLPILYTKGQGVDGLLDEEVGEKVNALSVKSIANGLARIIDNPDAYMTYKVVKFDQFRWDLIARRYFELYKIICC